MALLLVGSQAKAAGCEGGGGQGVDLGVGAEDEDARVRQYER